MTLHNTLSRRSFLAAAAATPLLAVPQGKRIPIGLELYSVRGEMQKDLKGTVTAVGKMGYEVVEFYNTYYSWTLDQAKEIRKLMDDLGIKCHSTHNSGMASFTGDGIAKAIELNKTIGSNYIIMASAGRVQPGIDGWKKVAETITSACEKFRAAGMKSGFHNHKMEFVPIGDKRPMEVLADNTPKDFTLQLDVGTCVEAGVDPIAWINAHPGRITSLHLKDWAAGQGPDKGFRTLFGEGDCPWKKVFEAAESKGGAEFYLIEQEGSRFSEIETAQRCLAEYKKIHG